MIKDVDVIKAAIGFIRSSEDLDQITKDVATMALTEMRQKKPLKPLVQHLFPSGVMVLYCPACNYQLTAWGQRYCMYCGQFFGDKEPEVDKDD